MQHLLTTHVCSASLDRLSWHVAKATQLPQQGDHLRVVTCWAPPKPRTAPRSFSCCISRSAAASASGPCFPYTQPTGRLRSLVCQSRQQSAIGECIQCLQVSDMQKGAFTTVSQASWIADMHKKCRDIGP